MLLKRKCLQAMLAVMALGAAQSVFAQSSVANDGGIGNVNFRVECNSAAQSDFNVAMAYYYSYDWSKINSAVNRVLQDDPTCGMAYWVRAMAALNNPFGWPASLPASAMKDGPSALNEARKTGLKSQRERDYVDALSVFFNNGDKIDRHVRALALESAFEKLASDYPDDSEASVLYAMILSANSDPADKQYIRELKAASILESVRAKQPYHPGVLHYLIHSYDYPSLAERGLTAARLYAKIAPDAPHALHMPSHIFTRLGLWDESIASNRAAYAAARSGTLQAFHFSDFMAYAYLQLGQVDAAREVLAQMRARPIVDDLGAAYPYAAVPARIAIATDSWKDAANLPLDPAADAYPWKKYPEAEAENAFARGIGAAMSGDPAKAREEVARMILLRDAATAMNLPYWAEQIDIQAEIVRGLAIFADGKHNEGIMVLGDAADRQDATDKSAVTAGEIVSAREMLATLLMNSGKPADALTEFETVLEHEPNLRRAVVGAARSAELAGNTMKAEKYADMLTNLK